MFFFLPFFWGGGGFDGYHIARASWCQLDGGHGGARLPTGGGHGVPAEAPRWDARLISIQDGWEAEERDGWQCRRLIMPFERRRRSKAPWKVLTS